MTQRVLAGSGGVFSSSVFSTMKHALRDSANEAYAVWCGVCVDDFIARLQRELERDDWADKQRASAWEGTPRHG